MHCRTLIGCLLLFPLSLALGKEMPNGHNGEKTLSIELFGGFSSMLPEDLNARNAFTQQYRTYYTRDFLTYSAEHDYIAGHESRQDGKFKRITYGLPFGFRLKMCVSKSIGFSLALSYVSRSPSSNVYFENSSMLHDGSPQAEIYEYLPQTISAQALIPMLGIHFHKALHEGLGIEAYMAGGPMFCNCTYAYRMLYFSGQRVEDYDRNNVYTRVSDVEGSGTGLSVDAGLRMHVRVYGRVGFFVEGGYAYQVATRLSGSGEQRVVDGSMSTWEGDWGMMRYSRTRIWGDMDTLYPTNSYDTILEVERYFKFDLSGIQLRMGFSFELSSW